MTLQETLDKIMSLGSQENLEGMAKVGINTAKACGATVTDLRKLAKEIKIDQALALKLWETGQHEARILATMIADKHQCDSDLFEKWVMEVNSWDLCDQLCNNLVYKTELGKMKAFEWCAQDEIFVKRAGFAIIANLAAKNKELTDAEIDSYSTLILNECADSRNYVRKAVSWALRNIGKRDEKNRQRALKIAKYMKDEGSKTAKTTSTEVLTELNSKENKPKSKYLK